MSDREPSTGAGFIRAYALPALLLFAIPVVGYLFVGYANSSWDAAFLEGAEKSISRDHSVNAAEKTALLAFYRSTPPSRLCAEGPAAHPEMAAEFFSEACGDYRQFGWIRTASRVVHRPRRGLARRHARLRRPGVRLARAAVRQLRRRLELPARRQRHPGAGQGFIAVMLSFWGTVVLTERYFVKLVAIVAVAALVAAFRSIVAIFKKTDDTLTVEGEVITRAGSPALWARVDGLCRRLGTQPATHIVGGIDDNFFVTEHPVHLSGHVLTGRTLFVSLSLLKRLDKGEADAVLAHEMAHFSGGDTQLLEAHVAAACRGSGPISARCTRAACRGRSSTSCCCSGPSCSSP